LYYYRASPCGGAPRVLKVPLRGAWWGVRGNGSNGSTTQGGLLSVVGGAGVPVALQVEFDRPVGSLGWRWEIDAG
jgi:hypothetical protein